MFIDYEILKLIWWLFIGVLLAGFAVMDGQDMASERFCLSSVRTTTNAVS